MNEEMQSTLDQQQTEEVVNEIAPTGAALGAAMVAKKTTKAVGNTVNKVGGAVKDIAMTSAKRPDVNKTTTIN